MNTTKLCLLLLLASICVFGKVTCEDEVVESAATDAPLPELPAAVDEGVSVEPEVVESSGEVNETGTDEDKTTLKADGADPDNADLVTPNHTPKPVIPTQKPVDRPSHVKCGGLWCGGVSRMCVEDHCELPGACSTHNNCKFGGKCKDTTVRQLGQVHYCDCSTAKYHTGVYCEKGKEGAKQTDNEAVISRDHSALLLLITAGVVALRNVDVAGQ